MILLKGEGYYLIWHYATFKKFCMIKTNTANVLKLAFKNEKISNDSIQSPYLTNFFNIKVFSFSIIKIWSLERINKV